jgi:hypothetical protein
MIKLGFAKEDITPDWTCRPVPLAGYFAEGRYAEGVHDRLYARALAFAPSGGAGEPVIILQLDLLCLDRICIDEIRKGLNHLGLSKENLAVFCIHTHSGFGGMLDTWTGVNREMVPLNGAFDRETADFVVDKCRAVIEKALENGGEAKIRIKKGTISGLAVNRHAPEMPRDDDLFIMEFLRDDGKKILLYNLCCHPTVLSGGNRLLSADFAGAAAALLEAPGICDMALFVNGSAGDMSTRFTRKESSFAECERFGKIVFDAVTEHTRGADGFVPLEQVSLSYHTFFLKRADIPGCAGAEKNLAETKKNLEETRSRTADPRLIRKAESFVEGASINLLKARYKDTSAGTEIPVEAGVLVLNGKKILCSPLELFSILALRLKRRRDVELFGYANALLGYLADSAAYDAMDYEALFSEFARGEGEHYIEEVEQII